MEYTMYCCQFNLGRYSGRLPSEVNREVRGQISTRAQIHRYFYSTYTPKKLSYDEYAECTLSVGRWDGEREDWPPAFVEETKKMNLLALPTQLPKARSDWGTALLQTTDSLLYCVI